MLENLFERDFYLQKHLKAPMLKEREDFLQYMSENETALYRLKLIADYLLRIIEYLHLEDGRIVSCEELDKAAIKWGESLTKHHMKRSTSKSGQLLFARYAKYWLEKLNRLEPLVEESFSLLKDLYENDFTQKRHLKYPLLQERISYLQYMKDNGRKKFELKTAASYMIRITEMLQPEDGRVITLKEVNDAASRWAVAGNHPAKKSAYSVFGKKHFMRIALEWLGWLGRLEQSPEEKYPLLNQLFNVRHALMRQVEAPLLDERIVYLQRRREQGVKLSSLHLEANLLLVVMDNLHFYDLHPVTIAEIKKSVERWNCAEFFHIRNKRYIEKTKLQLSCIAKSWLDMINCLIYEKPRSILFQRELDNYLSYLAEERGFSVHTIKCRKGILKKYLSAVEKNTSDLKSLSPLTIDSIIESRCEMGCSRRTIVEEVTILKLFLRYASEKGWCSKHLSDCIKRPRTYEHESLPSAPAWEDVKAIVAKCKTDSPTRIRDFAILQLLIVYGLRSSEVAGLLLEDLEWGKELLYIRRAKGGKPQIFPLVKSTGDAIIRYLREVRPNESNLRQVFLCMVAPFRPLNNKSIYQIVHGMLKPMKLEIEHQGPHALRHACATHLINTGFSLKEIGDHLGHQNLNSTRIYAKVDLLNLNKVSDMDWRNVL